MERRGQCIAVVSGKGGTGKTSLAAGVGAALALSGSRVLCLDCDVGLRNLDLTLGLSDRTLMDFSDVARGRCSLDMAAVEHPKVPGLFLLTAPVRMRGSPVTAEQMAQLLREVRTRYDFCLLDAPAGLGYGFQLATCDADRCIVVTTADATSLRDAQRAVTKLMGQIEDIHLVVNRVEPRMIGKLRTTIDVAMDTAGLPLLGMVPEDPQVLLCANQGTPLILRASRGAAIAYLNIARRLLGQRVPLMKLH